MHENLMTTHVVGTGELLKGLQTHAQNRTVSNTRRANTVALEALDPSAQPTRLCAPGPLHLALI